RTRRQLKGLSQCVIINQKKLLALSSVSIVCERYQNSEINSYQGKGGILNDLFFARSQMGMSLAFHIVFAVIGMAMPLLMAVSEGCYLWTKKPIFLELSKRWAAGTAILFAVGAVSGTVLSFELDCSGRGLCNMPAGSLACRSRSRDSHSSPKRSSWESIFTA